MGMKPCRECGNPVSTSAPSCPSCGVKSPTKAPMGKGRALLVIVGMLVFVGWCSGRVNQYGGSESAALYEAHRAYADSLELDFAWRAGGFDNVFIADFTIDNRGSRPVKDVRIACDLYAKSGTSVGYVKGSILEVFAGKDKRTVSKVNLGMMNPQTNDAKCAFADWSFAN